MLESLRYRLKYISLFCSFARVLKLKLSYRVIQTVVKGSSPKVYQDSTGEFHFNSIIDFYIQKHLARKKTVLNLSDEEVKILAINFKVLISLTRLNILKHLPFISFRSRRQMCEYLYKLKRHNED